MTSGPNTTRASITGMFTRNTEPHQKCSSSQPPSRGPTAAPPPAIADQTAIAVVR